MNKRTLVVDQLYNLAAGFLYALSICYFARGSDFAPGGISGLALIVNYLWHLPVGITTLVFNLPLVALSIRFVGRAFLAKSLVSMVWCTVFQDVVFARVGCYTGDPLVDCITNFVTVNDCANILLAVGGSPTMASDIREVQETAAAASALLCNLGAIDKVESMILGGQAANRAGKPVVFDPVGAGNTSLRRAESARLLDAVQFAVIRGNASEIRALAQHRAAGSGVDVSDADQITEKTLPRTVASARALAVQTGAVVAVSGPIDVLTDGRETILLHNGCATMSRVTGSGCMLTALMGAFCGAMPGQPFAAACAAAATMGVAGELAEARRLAHGTGNATFRTDLIDAVFNLTPAQLDASVRWESYSK